VRRLLGHFLRALMRWGLMEPVLTDTEWTMARTLRSLKAPWGTDQAQLLHAPMSTSEAIEILKSNGISITYEQR
jgi:hypothetical protein